MMRKENLNNRMPFLVIIPGTDDFPVCADDRPIVETEEVELALYCKGNYLKMRDEITTRLLDADITIVSRKVYGVRKMKQNYHHYIFRSNGNKRIGRRICQWQPSVLIN